MSIKKVQYRHGDKTATVEFDTSKPQAGVLGGFMPQGVPQMNSVPDHPGEPKGTDTVPAWLTPGEYVMNAEATRMFEPQIEAMNNVGRAMQAYQGGSVPEYKACGGHTKKPVYKVAGGRQSPIQGYTNDEFIMDTLLRGFATPEVLREVGYKVKEGPPPIKGEHIPYGLEFIQPVEQIPVDQIEPEKPNVDYLDDVYKSATQPSNYVTRPAEPPSIEGTLREPGKDKFIRNIGRPALKGMDFVAGLPQDSVGAVGDVISSNVDINGLNERFAVPAISGLSEIFENVPDQIGNTFDRFRRSSADAGIRSNEVMLEGLKQQLQDAVSRGDTDSVARLNREIANVESTLNSLRESSEGLTSSIDERDSRIDSRRVQDIDDMVARNEITKEQGEILKRKAKGEPDPVEKAVTVAKETEELMDDPEVQEEISGFNYDEIMEAANSIKPVMYTNKELFEREKAGKPVPDIPETRFQKAKNWFSETFKEVIDSDKLKEAALLYAGSRILGHSHRGSAAFVGERYVRGLDRKQKIADAASTSGRYDPESIKKFRDTGVMEDLIKLPAGVKSISDYKTYIKDGREFRLAQVEDMDGIKSWRQPDGSAVKISEYIPVAEYNTRVEKGTTRATKLLESRLMSTGNYDNKEDLAKVVDIPAIAAGIARYSADTGKSLGGIDALIPAIISQIERAGAEGIELDTVVGTQAILDTFVMSQNASNIEAFKMDDSNETVSVSELTKVIGNKDLRDPKVISDIDELYTAYMKLSKEERDSYKRKASKDLGQNGFVVFLATLANNR